MLTLLSVAPAAGSVADGGSIPLPTPGQRANLPANPTELLGPDRPNEIVNRAPGPIDDTEHVRVGLAADGSVVSVVVVQQLKLSGTGDFSLKIPGPALDVTSPPDAANKAGLRRGSVVWEGFSGGNKTLEATVTLDPAVEQFKLPLGVSVAGGQTRISNRSALPVPVADGDADPVSLGRLVEQVRNGLSSGGRPLAGSGGVPGSLPARSSVSTAAVDVAAPFRLVGEVRPPGAAPVPFDALVPGPAAPDGVLVVPAAGVVTCSATPASPDPSSLSGVSGRAALRAVEVALWQVLRAGDVSAYLGNPVIGGSSTTTYTYETARAPALVRVSPPLKVKPFAIIVAVLAAVAVLSLGAALWARS